MAKLNDKQLKAIEHIINGLSDGEVAELVGVTRETVNTWKNQNHDFIAELNKRRNSISITIQDKQRELVTKAYRVLDKHLDNQLNSDEIDVKTALDIIKMYKPTDPTLETDAEIMKNRDLWSKGIDEMLYKSS